MAESKVLKLQLYHGRQSKEVNCTARYGSLLSNEKVD